MTVDHHHEAVARREEIARAGRAKGDHYKRISGPYPYAHQLHLTGVPIPVHCRLRAHRTQHHNNIRGNTLVYATYRDLEFANRP